MHSGCDLQTHVTLLSDRNESKINNYLSSRSIIDVCIPPSLGFRGDTSSYLTAQSPCPSCPCSEQPQLHTSVCRVGNASWTSGTAPPSGVRPTARVLGRPAFLSSRGDTAGDTKSVGVSELTLLKDAERCSLNDLSKVHLCHFMQRAVVFPA